MMARKGATELFGAGRFGALAAIMVAALALFAALTGILMNGCDLGELDIFGKAVVVKRFAPNGEIAGIPEHIEVEFSASMRRATTEYATIVSSQEGELIDGRFSWKSDDRIMIFSPDIPFPAREAITTTVYTDAEDINFNSLNEQLVFRFRVETAVPSVVELLPEDGAQNVETKQEISFLFSEPIRRDDLYESFTISPTVLGTFIWMNDDREARFVPLEPLAYGQRYRLSISGSVRSISGAAIGDSEFWIFKTMSLPSIYPIAVSLISPNALPIIDEAAIDLIDRGKLLSSIEDALISDVSAEYDDLIAIRFASLVTIEERLGIISISPSVDFDMSWYDEYRSVIVRPLDRLRWGESYRLRVGESAYRFAVNGAMSRPPQVELIAYRPDIDSPESIALTEGGDVDFIPGSSGAFDIEITMPEGANLNISSIIEHFDIDPDDIFRFTILDVVAIHEELENGEERDATHSIIARAMVDIEQEGAPPSIVSFSIGREFVDDRGIPGDDDFTVSVNGF